MRVINCLGTAFMLSAICCFGSSQASLAVGNESSASTSAGYTITLTQPTNPFSLDSTIRVIMTVKNTTHGDVLWRAVRGADGDKDSWYPEFRFLLKKEGKEVETTFFHRKISGRQRPNDPVEVWSGSTILLPMPPGIMFKITVDLKRLYQITEPGQYTLEISRIAEDDKTIIHSNTVTFSVVP